MRKNQGKSYWGKSSQKDRSIGLLSFRRWVLAQHGLQLVMSLNFGEKVSQFFIFVGLEKDPSELQRAFQIHTLSFRTGAAGVYGKLRSLFLRSSKGLQRVAFRDFQGNVVELGKGVLIIDRILARPRLEDPLVLRLEQRYR